MTLEEIRHTAETQSTAEEINRALQSIDDFFHQNENALSDSQLVDLIDLRAVLVSRLSRAEHMPQQPAVAAQPQTADNTRTADFAVGGLLAAIAAAFSFWIYRHRR